MHLKNTILLSAVLLFVYSTGCANDETSIANNTSNSSDTTGLAPVETKSPNSNYKPAFAGQTRISGAKTTTPYKVEKIAEKMGAPFAVVAMPDGRLMVTLKKGYMEIHDANGKLVKKIEGLPEVLFAGQGGLLDVAFDPDFKNNKMMYWSYSEKNGSKNLTAVAKGKLNEAAGRVDNPTVIFRATPALNSNLHFGSRLIFDKDGNLFVSAGERSILEGRAQAQLLESHLGKVFKITKDGKPAPGNPFINKAGAAPEIYSYGHRNPQGLDINPATGELWEVEFGPRGGDEINIIRAGKDYGWPVITYGIEYSGEKVGDGIQQKAGLEQPVYYWDPVVSPSGISFYKGNSIPEWKNNLFIACLSGQHIDRLIIKNNKVVGEERLLADKNERFRDIAYMNNALYVLTDSGDLYKISRK
ncbi:PQQ-dependent sugar dehydrogenase [Parafilimonas terrae]|uniref:Glucose/arabinose dehydrogenase, beta-propeller fold n=1 Tax=Parafilimonas terrae TaxID=1465490 RepID=A0A1I5X0U6_9BACT|nr:PQQ-dependent sugar dehydrogenase [Parafilimonas terrae]SFQ25652.1 Glucose/arabinose dehydrogenase, beta-propeller fold [Parafilimonas terrae]